MKEYKWIMFLLLPCIVTLGLTNQYYKKNGGDYWGVAGAMEDIRAMKKSDSEYVYNPAGQLYTFSANSNVGRRCIKGDFTSIIWTRL